MEKTTTYDDEDGAARGLTPPTYLPPPPPARNPPVAAEHGDVEGLLPPVERLARPDRHDRALERADAWWCGSTVDSFFSWQRDRADPDDGATRHRRRRHDPSTYLERAEVVRVVRAEEDDAEHAEREVDRHEQQRDVDELWTWRRAERGAVTFRGGVTRRDPDAPRRRERTHTHLGRCDEQCAVASEWSKR